MKEPLVTFLMPIYAVISWYGLFAQSNSDKYMLPVALVGWLWAAVNIYLTRRLDLGIVTFAFVALAALWERAHGFSGRARLALSASSILVAANYSLVIIFWQQIQKGLPRSKSQLWMNIFRGYCACMVVFWACAAAKTWARGRTLDRGPAREL